MDNSRFVVSKNMTTPNSRNNTFRTTSGAISGAAYDPSVSTLRST